MSDTSMQYNQIAGRAPVGRIIWAECKMELLKAWRTPGFALPTMLFPTVFYTIFGVVLGGTGVDRATYMLATYGIFAAMGTSLFAFGVAIANERDRGWLEIKRAAPMPFSALLIAKLFMAMVFTFIVTMMLFAIAAYGGGVRLTAFTWLSLVGLNLFTTIPFAVLGLAIGLRAKAASSAAALTQLIYFPLSLLGGLWVPISVFPKAFATIALALPSFHFGELALTAIGIRTAETMLINIAAVGAFSIFVIFLAHRGWRYIDKDR
ncbi:MAG: antibiotic transporter permease [Kordiimonadales bacterium]|nr:MAG: antibiotic transporter permease [Kordiimonadales bacterium]